MMYVHMTETTTLQMHESMCSLLESRESNINSLATELNSTETNSTANRLSTGAWSYQLVHGVINWCMELSTKLVYH